MKNKKFLEILTKIKSDLVRNMMIESYNKMNNVERKKAASMIESFGHTLENDLNFKAKAIAAYIRMNMEDFHHKHLSDEQMKELNPLIRNAIYTFLVDEINNDLFDISSVCKFNLPSYWEDCEYIREH